ncbi:MAG: pyrimidine/purine nucleoside phosphorylase [Desulfuromonas sp.]|nr:pyrimidine/purine nucleoside phosphorylase [Desulfuromonas sp.]
MDYCSPYQFKNSTVECKANIYFDGKVVSHSLTTADGERKTLGVIFPGSYKFDTDAAERMEIIAGNCKVRIAGSGDWVGFGEDTWFDVPAKSFFEIEVSDSVTEYVCSFC